MADRTGSFFSRDNINLPGTAVAASIWTFPIIVPGFLWLQFFSPLPVFYYLYNFGYTKGMNTLTAAALITGLLALASGNVPAVIFPFVMLPAGYTMARSAVMGGSPVRTGLNGLITLLICWFLLSILYGMTHQVGLYQEILKSVKESVTAAGQMILSSSEMSTEYRDQLQQTFSQLKEALPGIMPGLLITTMLNLIFCNLLVGQWLLRRFSGSKLAWPPFREWRLPDQLISAIIVAGVCIMIPVAMIKIFGLNLLFAAGTLYLFQGLAVLATLLHKWAVPTALKTLIYLLVLVQAYGVIMLAFLGITDIWVDFGKKKPVLPTDDN